MSGARLRVAGPMPDQDINHLESAAPSGAGNRE